MRKGSFTLVDYGVYYGYPMCCIGAFIERMSACRRGFPYPMDERKLSGTGYVPCLLCNKKSEEELLVAIAANRKCPKPFPIENDGDDDL